MAGSALTGPTQKLPRRSGSNERYATAGLGFEMKIFLAFFLFFATIIEINALPYIPGCPLHESCVRTFKQEQRQRQRERRQRESPDAPREAEDGDEGEDGETKAVKKPLGIILGFQIDLGDFNDRKNDYINLRPSVAYLNGFGNLDVFASFFYTLSLDDPGLSPAGKGEKLETMSRGGLNTTVGYTFDISESFTLAPELGNQLYFDFTPDANPLNTNGKILSYAVLEPLLRIGYDTEIGDLSLSNSFPISYIDDMALDYTVSASFNTIVGLGLAVSCQFWNLWVDPDSEYGSTNPGFQYGGTDVTVSFWRGSFFASLTLTADGEFKQFSVEPYLSYRIKQLTLFTSVLLTNLGEPLTYDQMRLNKIQGRRDVTGVIPTIGAKYRF